MPNTEPPDMRDPATWAHRFDELVRLVKNNAEVARNSAADAVVRVTAENARAQQQIKHDLLAVQDQDRKRQDVLHSKVDVLGGQMNQVLVTLNKLTTAKLIQVAATALILAALVVIGMKAIAG